MNQGARRVADSQAGAMAVTIAIFLVGFLAMVALVFDFGHVVWVKNELQKAADAGSLSGARCLWPYVGVPSTPNWTAAQTAATQTVLLNRADGQLLTNCDLQSGYWNLATKTLESTGVVPTASHLPGIRVTVSKAPGHNGGPVALMFAAFFGLVPQNLTAQATAVITGPATIPPRGGAFPMAVPKVMVEQYWNREPPVSFRIGSPIQTLKADNGPPSLPMPTTSPLSGNSWRKAIRSLSRSAIRSGWNRAPRPPSTATPPPWRARP